MKCELCGENQANLHFTKLIDGKLEEKHICEKCAKEDSDFGLGTPFSMHKLFTDIIDGFQGDMSKDTDLKCDNCGMSYREFRNGGKFGCSNCYIEFRSKLSPLFKSIHGADRHIGKIPKSSSKELKIEREKIELKNKLDEAVSKEKYEDAVIYRDKLRELDKAKLEEEDDQ